MSGIVTYAWKKIVSLQTGNAENEIAASPMLNEKIVSQNIAEYEQLFSDSHDQIVHGNAAQIEARKAAYKTVVDHYYDMATDFYEKGWGHSFHFAPRFHGESFHASVARHEHWLAAQIGMRPHQKVLDVGCGIGGPMRNMARFSGSQITGVTINHYQVNRGNTENKKQKLDHLCQLVQCDFMKLPEKFGQAVYDHAYAIEATCHAPDKTGCFRSVFETLKPGGYFAGYEWVMTKNYDPTNPLHRRIKYDIEKGDALPELANPEDVVKALQDAGFEVIDHADLAETAKMTGQHFPWYKTLGKHLSIETIAQSSYGRSVTHYLVQVLEALHIAPKGTFATHQVLQTAANALVEGGELEIFTPMYFFIARKPNRA